MKKYIIILALLAVGVGCIGMYQKYTYEDDKLHVTFCAVGQGDAILIKTPKNSYVLVDGGPDKSVLDCLARHVPFWQRTLDGVLLSHPHADHYFGLHFVFRLYTVRSFMTEAVAGHAEIYKQIIRTVPLRHLYRGDTVVIDDVQFEVLSPSREDIQTMSGSALGESTENVSLMTHVRYHNFDALLTGDIPAEELQKAVADLDDQIEVLQSPHHGSKTGMNTLLVAELLPELAVISVGKNTYGHPHKVVLDVFEQYGIPYKSTDTMGDVEIITDGTNWRVVE